MRYQVTGSKPRLRPILWEESHHVNVIADVLEFLSWSFHLQSREQITLSMIPTLMLNLQTVTSPSPTRGATHVALAQPPRQRRLAETSQLLPFTHRASAQPPSAATILPNLHRSPHSHRHRCCTTIAIVSAAHPSLLHQTHSHRRLFCRTATATTISAPPQQLLPPHSHCCRRTATSAAVTAPPPP